MAVVDRRSARDSEILERFCRGQAPSEIDEGMGLNPGTARSVISSWWLDDKLTRCGCAETILSAR